MNEELLIRFLTHTCTPEDIREIDQWIQSDPKNANWLFEMERIWSLKDELRFSDKLEIEQAYDRFMYSVTAKKKIRLTGWSSWRSISKYAAILLILVLLSLNIYKLYNENTENENTIEVPNGQRISLTLSDGTKVWLNSQTKFVYPGTFSKKNRDVYLEGEAFFEVAKDKKKPFTVKSPLLRVTVLGTKFNLRSYAEESSIVTLAEGKVQVSTNNEENQLILLPNEQMTYSVEEGVHFAQNIDPDFYKSWTKGESAFMNKKLREICRELERKFDIKIQVTDENLANDVFNCRFKESASIEQVLTLLKETRRLDYTSDGKQILIYKPKNKMPM